MKPTISSLNKRVAALERVLSARQQTLAHLIQDAVASARTEQNGVELLVSACGAENIGRPLTEAEVHARRTFERRLRMTCRREGITYPVQFDHRSYLRFALCPVIALRLDDATLELAEKWFTAQAVGEETSEAENAAVLVCDTQFKRAHQLASGELTLEDFLKEHNYA